MNDMRSVIVPKSDQVNADDFLSGPMTVIITGVTLRPGQDQPITINFDGDNGKPYKPCKSMARVMVHCWGPDANVYTGRRMTLYCDPKVMWGGMAVGGIRISHMSHIDAPKTMALTATKGNKKPFTVKPLVIEEAPAVNLDALTIEAKIAADLGTASYVRFWAALAKAQKAALLPQHAELKAMAAAADAPDETTIEGETE